MEIKELQEISFEHIDEVMRTHWKEMLEPRYCFSTDNNENNAEEWESKKLRILFVSNSSGETRSISNTPNALRWVIGKAIGLDNLYWDQCFLPEREDVQFYNKYKLPWWFGRSSHHPAKDFDLIILAMNIVPEVFNVFHGLRNSGFPLTFDERQKTKLPPIFIGGASASEDAILYGPMYDEQGNYIGKSAVDMCYYGYAETSLPDIITNIYKYHTEIKPIKEDRKSFFEWMIENKVGYGKLFYPGKYTWNYRDDRYTINSITPDDIRLPDRVDFNKMHNNKFEGFPLKAIHMSGAAVSNSDAMISSGCSGANSVCSFCMEATVAGNYYERSLEDIEENLKFIRDHAASNGISYFSFNLNYFSRFFDLLYTGSKYFANISLHNERLDIIANAPEQLKLAKQLGLKRFAGAIEGISDRIRNKILNKNLPRETLLKAFRHLFEQKLMHLKLGFIMTGQETEEDIDEFIKDFNEILRIRDEVGASSYIQMNFTPLVLYSQIALRHLPRNTAKACFLNQKTGLRLVEFAKEKGMRIKFNAKGPGTWIEQMILDFGPMGTNLLKNVALLHGVEYRAQFNDNDKQAMLIELEKMNMDPLWNVESRPEDWIFPNDHINYATPELKKAWWNRTQNLDYEAPLCLHTLAQLSPKCAGCKTCDPSHIKDMLHRDMKDRHTYEDVVTALSENKMKDIVRIVVKQNPDWVMYDHTAFAHYITSRFMQQSEAISKAFYKVATTTTDWTRSHNQVLYAQGTWAVDIELSERVPQSEFDRCIPLVNEILHAGQVVRVFTGQKEMRIKSTLMNSFVLTTPVVSMTLLKEKIQNWDEVVPIAQKRMSTSLDVEKIHMPGLKEKILLTNSKHGPVLYITVPANVNPFLMLSAILKVNYRRVIENWQVSMVDSQLPIENTCKCGNQTGVSYFTGKQLPLCSQCVGKILLSKMQ